MTKIDILALASGMPRLDLRDHATGRESAARTLLGQLFPGRIGAAIGTADLLTAGFPEFGHVYAGTFGGTTVACGQDLVELTDLAAAVAPISEGRNAFHLQINSAIDSLALEIVGPDGGPVRELMIVGSEGVIVDAGPRLDAEAPFWSGEHDPDGAYAAMYGDEIPFEPNDLAEELLRTVFGFVVDADSAFGDLDASQVRLHGFLIAADATDEADRSRLRGAGTVPGQTPAPGLGESGGDIADTDSVAHRSWWARLLDRLAGRR